MVGGVAEKAARERASNSPPSTTRIEPSPSPSDAPLRPESTSSVMPSKVRRNSRA